MYSGYFVPLAMRLFILEDYIRINPCRKATVYPRSARGRFHEQMGQGFA